jgi:hypothetical protein
MMTHDTQARCDAKGLLAQMRSILDTYDAERFTIGDVDIYVGLILHTLEKLWDVVGRSDVTRDDGTMEGYRMRYKARACAAVVGDLCRQPDWDNARDPATWDTYSFTIRTLRWLLDVALYSQQEATWGDEDDCQQDQTS